MTSDRANVRFNLLDNDGSDEETSSSVTLASGPEEAPRSFAYPKLSNRKIQSPPPAVDNTEDEADALDSFPDDVGAPPITSGGAPDTTATTGALAITSANAPEIAAAHDEQPTTLTPAQQRTTLAPAQQRTTLAPAQQQTTCEADEQRTTTDALPMVLAGELCVTTTAEEQRTTTDALTMILAGEPRAITATEEQRTNTIDTRTSGVEQAPMEMDS